MHEINENSARGASTGGPICTKEAARAAGLDIAPSTAELTAMAESIVAANNGVPCPEVDLARAVPLLCAELDRQRDQVTRLHNDLDGARLSLWEEEQKAVTIHESAVHGEPGDSTTAPVRVLNHDAEGRALVLVEGDGEQLRHGDVVTVDIADLHTNTRGQ